MAMPPCPCAGHRAQQPRIVIALCRPPACWRLNRRRTHAERHGNPARPSGQNIAPSAARW